MKISGNGLGLAHDLGDASPGPVTLELTLGTRRYCLEFGGTETAFKPGRKLVRRDAGTATGCGPQ